MRRFYTDRADITHLTQYLGEQYVLGGQARVKVYSTLCGDKLVEQELQLTGKLSCMSCIAQEQH